MADIIHPIDIHIMPEQIQFGTVGMSYCIGWADGWPCYDDNYSEFSIADMIKISAYRGGIIKKMEEGSL